MKTVFITSSHVLISRNILSTPLFERLASHKDLRIVLFVPRSKADFFIGAFRRDNVVVEGIEYPSSALDAFLKTAALLTTNSMSVKIKNRAQYEAQRNLFSYLIKETISRVFAGGVVGRKLLRQCDSVFGTTKFFDRYFDQYRPDLVFATDVQNDADVACMRSAFRRSIPVVGMVRSWDNLTSKGTLRVIPDILMVTSEQVRREAREIVGMPDDQIRVIGIPHYDQYSSRDATPRNVFFKAIGLDPKKRLALIAPIGDRYVCEFQSRCSNETDRHILEVLVDGQKKGRLPADLQFLVRLPPADSVNLDGFTPPETMIIEQPGVPLGGRIKEQELSRHDDQHLIDSLAHADLVITGPSTIALDAAFFDKPIIVPNFDAAERPYYQSIARFYQYDHFRPIMKSGGVIDCRDPEILLGAVAQSLQDQNFGKEGRARIVAEQCGPADGHASERLLDIIVGSLASK